MNEKQQKEINELFYYMLELFDQYDFDAKQGNSDFAKGVQFASFEFFCLLGDTLGLLEKKEESDETWQNEQKSKHHLVD